jgi:hypothetical protein
MIHVPMPHYSDTDRCDQLANPFLDKLIRFQFFLSHAFSYFRCNALNAFSIHSKILRPAIQPNATETKIKVGHHHHGGQLILDLARL